MTDRAAAHSWFLAGLAVSMIAVLASPAAAGQQANRRQTMFQSPAAIKAEHEALHTELEALTRLPGKTGDAAKRVADVLHEHFVREEELAMPPLGLLEPLASGRVTPEMREVIAVTDRLKAEMPRMLNEHKAIVQALEELGRAATAERQADASRFVEELTGHAHMEEQVLYPAAILVGEYVKLRLPR